MSAVYHQMRDAGAILPALDAPTNPRALAVEFLSLAIGLLVLALFASRAMQSTSFGTFAAGNLLFLLCAGVGFNTAGVLLMDEAASAPRRSIGDALCAGVLAFAKATAILLLAGLGALAIVLALALLLWICSIPGVGPLLSFVVFPLGALVVGLLWMSLAFVLAPIAGPALWSGESILAALARVTLVMRKRLLAVLVRGCVLFLLLLVTATVLWLIALAGLLGMAAMSIGIAGLEFDRSAVIGLFGGEMGGAYGAAMLASLGLSLVVAGTLLSLVLKKGWCLIYLQIARDLDVSAVQAEMRAALAQVQAQAQSARERVQQQQAGAALQSAGSIQETSRRA